MKFMKNTKGEEPLIKTDYNFKVEVGLEYIEKLSDTKQTLISKKKETCS